MAHDSLHPLPAQIDDPVAGTTWVVSLSSIIILTALVLATCVFYFRFENAEIDIKVIEPPSAWVTGLKRAQLGQLAVYQKFTVTAPDGSEEPRIRIPIARAMELVAADATKPAPKAVVIPVAPAATPTGTLPK
ncbi:MAG: hypothetical protein EXS01_07625 [Phycisphaerales bacterium]|nr:hypothetical protein [Phycisphaerales bacterium]